VTRSAAQQSADDAETDLTWAELSDKMSRERLEHERLRQQDADVIRDLRLSEDLTVQLLDLRAQSFNTERRRLLDELNSVRMPSINPSLFQTHVHSYTMKDIQY